MEDNQQILTNTLVVDNASEALYECIEEGTESYSMLICEVNCSDGIKRQVHIVVTGNENDFIDNTEEMPLFNHNEEYRLINQAQQ